MAKKGKTQIALEYAAARALLSGLGALPRPLAMAAGRGLGRLAYAVAGGLRLTAHLGAWELLCFAHSAFYNPIHFLVRPLDNPRVEELIERMRMRFGNQPIDKGAAALTAMRLLRRGGTLGILADLNTQPREGVFVPFFGRLACTTAGAATLALRTDATVIPCCAPWDPARKKFVFRGGPVLELIRTGDDARDVEINTALFTAAIEEQVRRFPDQWLWIHKRWKTRPEGEPDFYSELGESAPPSEFKSQAASEGIFKT